MKSNCGGRIEDLIDELYEAGRSKDGDLVEELFDEATVLEDDLEGAKSKIKDYEDLLDDICELIEYKRKTEIECYGVCPSETMKLIKQMWRYKEIKNARYSS